MPASSNAVAVAEAANAFLATLSEQQRATVQIERLPENAARWSNFPAASKNLVRQAIAAWTGDSVQAAEYRKLYDAELNQTKVAYSGTTALNTEGDYVRIDGPHVWIKFACQGSDHYHTIWRDRASDYGAEFSF